MKKVLLVVVAAITMMASNVSAQETKFGVKAGLNYATLGGDAEDASGRIGYHIGAYGKFGISESFALKPELVYSLQGAQDSEDGDFKTNLTYLNIPILAAVRLTDGLNLEVGPQIGILMGAKFKSGDNSLDFKDEANSIDFGVGAGFNYELESGLNFGIRYNLGLGNIAKDSDDFKMTNQVIQLSLGFSF